MNIHDFRDKNITLRKYLNNRCMGNPFTGMENVITTLSLTQDAQCINEN